MKFFLRNSEVIQLPKSLNFNQRIIANLKTRKIVGIGRSEITTGQPPEFARQCNRTCTVWDDLASNNYKKWSHPTRTPIPKSFSRGSNGSQGLIQTVSLVRKVVFHSVNRVFQTLLYQFLETNILKILSFQTHTLAFVTVEFLLPFAKLVRVDLWILRGRQRAKSVLKNCVICRMTCGRPFKGPGAPHSLIFELVRCDRFHFWSGLLRPHSFLGKESSKAYIVCLFALL